MLKTKSVHSPVDRDDGLRLLATRFRGRGLKATLYDVWMANLGPSEELLRLYKAGTIKWAEFSRRYKAEMFESLEWDRKIAPSRPTARSSPFASSKDSPPVATLPSCATAPRMKLTVTASCSSG